MNDSVEREHYKFIRIVDRLRQQAEQQGDAPLADALQECLLHVSGGGECPMGQLILQDAIRTGHLPGAGMPQRTDPATVSSPPASIAALNPELLGERFHAMSRKTAMAKNDQAYRVAINECEHFMQQNPLCPMHRLLQPNPVVRHDDQRGAHDGHESTEV